ncbi:uncharacterized protein LOC132752175, partial [Ruditapes philippinarum]|uniref:uncharacterized protein LOC132752175 n=1 Tax=Ruditapes philippinarum TaxID=129788 RepID=UPI00295C0584
DSKKQHTPHTLLSPNAKQPENDVTILCHPDCSNDLLHADKIEKELVKNNFKVVKDYEGGNEPGLTIKPAKWYILVVSKTTFNSTNLTAFKCAACLDNSITNDSVSVLPVLVGVEPCEIPAMIRWVTMISVTDHNYLEAILQIVKGQPVRMQDKIPCGDVATGLAWACYINYLSITMEPGLRDRIVKLMKSKDVMCDCIEKLFIIVPLSCKTEPKLAEKANETSETPVIQYVGKSEVVEKELAGQHRTFYIHMYKYTDPETENSVCFMSEYCAAINNIKEMGNLPFSGITREDMSRQCEKFVEVMEDIMNRKAVKDKLGDISKLVHFVFYDDSKQTLIEAIKEQIIGGDYNMICRKDHYHYFLLNVTVEEGREEEVDSNTKVKDSLVGDQVSARSSSSKEKTMSREKRRGICSTEDVQKGRFLEIEEEKLALARETLELKKRKVQLLEESVSFQKRTAEAVESMLHILRDKQIESLLSNTLLEC